MRVTLGDVERAESGEGPPLSAAQAATWAGVQKRVCELMRGRLESEPIVSGLLVLAQYRASPDQAERSLAASLANRSPEEDEQWRFWRKAKRQRGRPPGKYPDEPLIEKMRELQLGLSLSEAARELAPLARQGATQINIARRLLRKERRTRKGAPDKA